MTIGTPVECFQAEHTTLTAATSVESLVTGMAVGTTGFILVGSTAAKIVSSVVDSKGNVWTVDVTKAGAAEAVSICSAPITVALVPADTVTITWSSASSSTTDVSIQNVSGLPSAAYVDKTASANGAATPAASTATTALTLGNEIAWAVNAFGTTAATPGTGFTGVTTNPVGGGTQTTVEYQIVNSVAAVNGTFTGGTGAWASAIATYKGTANAVAAKGGYGPSSPTTALVVGADQAVKTTAGQLCGLTINPTGAVTPTVTVYDNASAASGNILFGPCKIQSGVSFSPVLPDQGVNATNGIFVHADAWTTVTVTAYVK